MTYFSTPTVITGDLWSAASHNLYLGDNLDDHESRILSLESGLFSGASVALDALGQTITNATEATISWDTEEFDTDAYWSAGSPTRLTLPTDGYYQIGGSVYWQGDATGIRVEKIRVDGGDYLDVHSANPATASNRSRTLLVGPILLSAASYVEVRVNQLSGDDLDVYGEQSIPGRPTKFWIQRLEDTT